MSMEDTTRHGEDGMTGRVLRAGMAGMVLALLVSLTGCVKVSMEIGVAPDGSTRGRMLPC